MPSGPASMVTARSSTAADQPFVVALFQRLQRDEAARERAGVERADGCHGTSRPIHSGSAKAAA